MRLRIVTWNCSRGPLQRKLDAVSSLEPDIAVLSECPGSVAEPGRAVDFREPNARYGVQVRAFGDYRVERISPALAPTFVNPVRVIGPHSFTLLAVWTWPAPTYIKAFDIGFSAYEHLLLEQNSVVAGDFNGSPYFDRPRTKLKWADQFSRLESHGLVSAYHHTRGLLCTAQCEPTHVHRSPGYDPVHIDFCFVPESWSGSSLKATIANEVAWAGLSDHFPIIVDTRV